MAYQASNASTAIRRRGKFPELHDEAAARLHVGIDEQGDEESRAVTLFVFHNSLRHAEINDKAGTISIRLFKAKIFHPVHGPEWHLSTHHETEDFPIIVKRARMSNTVTFSSGISTELTRMTHKLFSKRTEFVWNNATYRWTYPARLSIKFFFSKKLHLIEVASGQKVAEAHFTGLAPGSPIQDQITLFGTFDSVWARIVVASAMMEADRRRRCMCAAAAGGGS